MMSTVTPSATEPAAAERAGAELRAARERLGLSLQDAAFSLRIRVAHLKALEAGRISLLPGNAYALAFVRTYANMLGLDAEAMVRRFRTEAPEFGRRTELVFPVPMPERGLPAGAVLPLGLVLAVGAYAGWYRLSGDGRLPAETVTAIPERLASLAEQAMPRMQGSKTELAMIAAPRIAQDDPVTPNISADPAPPPMAISPTSAAAAQLPPRPAEPAPVEGLVPAVDAPAEDASRIVSRANAESWLMVKSRAGAVLLNRVLKAGETWPLPPRTDLLLTTGNAGGTDIVVDGATTLGLGPNGAVRRDLPLDPDQIKGGKLAVAAPPPFASIRPRQ